MAKQARSNGGAAGKHQQGGAVSNNSNTKRPWQPKGTKPGPASQFAGSKKRPAAGPPAAAAGAAAGAKGTDATRAAKRPKVQQQRREPVAAAVKGKQADKAVAAAVAAADRAKASAAVAKDAAKKAAAAAVDAVTVATATAAPGADGTTAHAAPAAGVKAAARGATAINANWQSLKEAVAAAKRPPPPEHIQKKIRRRQEAAAAAAGASAGDAAATAGGRRPGVVGSDTGLTKVLAIDCEMVGTGPKGSVSTLARVCLVNSSGVVLLDTFVKPKEKVTDYRTWVSGVRPSDVANGRPHEDVIQQVAHMVAGRILVGHSIGNDLRALRLEAHPRELLRDTAKYPGLMKELPGGRKVSASLKDLAATHLGLVIQQGEHTPVDDARAALYLYQKFHREWEAAVRAGNLTPVSGLGRSGKGDR
ncbi:hypothetical protein Agub_g7152, partial [Astrephomene gubernaculifera]